MGKNDKVIKEAVKDAQHTLTKRVEPDGISSEKAINELLTTLDNDEVVEAVMASDEKEEQEPKKEKAPKSQPAPRLHLKVSS